MNIFYLDSIPAIAAQHHCDKHVVKMILETAQLLSTAHNVLDGNKDGLYKTTHVNHPSNVWVRASIENYAWAYSLFVNLCDEYTHRYGKVHATSRMIDALAFAPDHIPRGVMTAVPLCMPDEFKIKHDPIGSYRKYYESKQDKFNMRWTNRKVPSWFKARETND